MKSLKKLFTVFYNDGCSKCRATLDILKKESDGAEVELVEYLETPPSTERLGKLLSQLGLEPEAIVRKSEERYEELGLHKNPPATREAWIQVLVANPILIERPIVTDGRRAVVARPPEKVRELLR